MTKRTVLFACFAVCVMASAASAVPIRHVPPAEVVAGTNLELVAEAPSATPTLMLHYRAPGVAAFSELELVRRDDEHWVAVVPAAQVVSPGIEYYIAAGGKDVFASATSPHTMPVTATASTERRTRDFTRSDGRRSRINTAFEWVDYGTRSIGGNQLTDRYYRVDADFSYRLWAYPLEELRVGYTGLLGETRAEECGTGPSPCTDQAGFKVGGWFELGLAPTEGVRLDGRVMVMATQSGFRPGGRGEVRLGDRDASHIALGVEYLADVGTSGFFRLGWGTVPKVPMSATVEITRLPSSFQETGVRLYYDIAHEFGQGFRLGARFGYAARNQAVIGFTTGANATLDF